jgi:hypothetical protein
VFDAFVNYSGNYGIIEWGINQSSLEDVFIKVSENYLRD